MLDTKQILMDFTTKTGVSGMEGDSAAFARTLLSRYGKTDVTPLGSVICTVKAPHSDGAHILLDAHMDEIGMIVTMIGDKGFLRVGACGGMDRRILPASPVQVHTAQGIVDGVVCSTPPHLNTDGDKKNPKVDELYIDIGYTQEDAKALVSPGDRVTVAAQARTLLGGLVSGRAIDDRAGCVALLKVLDYMEDREPDCGLSVLFSSMEEVGGMGAKTAAYSLNPTHAVAVDVSYAHTPDAPREKCGILGDGPMIGFSPILSSAVSRRLVSLAKENGIPYQCEIMGGRTGTNIDSIATTRNGVISGLVSIPEKYMHTPSEVVSIDDIENTAKLIASYIRSFGDWNGL
jgi:endoglucanase